MTVLQLLGYTSPSSTICTNTNNDDAHKQQPAPRPPSCSPNYYYGFISGWEASKVSAAKVNYQAPPTRWKGFFIYPEWNEPTPSFVPADEGQTNAGSLEKDARTATCTAKARTRAHSDANTTAQRAIEPGTRGMGDGGWEENRRTRSRKTKEQPIKSPESRAIYNLQSAICNSQNPSRRAARAMPLDSMT